MIDNGNEEKKLNIVGNSLPFEVQIPRLDAQIHQYDGYIEISVDDLMPINVMFDFMDGRPPYGSNNDWWYYDVNLDTIHVMVAEIDRVKYVEIMEKKAAGQELTKDDNNELETFEVLVEGLSRVAAERAGRIIYKKRVENLQDSSECDIKIVEDTAVTKKAYRTKSKAGDVVRMPNKFAIITQRDYQNAMGLFQAGHAYMQPLITADGLKYDKGKLFFNGVPASQAELKEYYTDKVPEDINLPLLRVFYSIVLNTVANDIKNHRHPMPTFTVYVPELLSFIGLDKPSRKQTINIIENIMNFQTIMGVIDGDILPVLVYLGEEQSKNTLTFSAPYMNRVIEKVYNVSIKRDKKGKPLLKANGELYTSATHSYLIKPTIVKEKNKKAVEIVNIVIATIEQTGSKGVPHISAKTIVERNLLLRYSLDGSTTADKNKMLKRAFGKAWELLESQTLLKEAYEDIELPDPKNVPTMSVLEETVYEFKHKGKRKKG